MGEPKKPVTRDSTGHDCGSVMSESVSPGWEPRAARAWRHGIAWGVQGSWGVKAASMSCWGAGYVSDPFVKIHRSVRLRPVHSLFVNFISIKSKMKSKRTAKKYMMGVDVSLETCQVSSCLQSVKGARHAPQKLSFPSACCFSSAAPRPLGPGV